MTGRFFLKRCLCIVLIGLACGTIMIIVQRANLLNGVECMSIDFRFLRRGTIPVNDKIIIIGTDEEALDKIEDPFIFWNPYFAAVIKAVAKGGARVIGFDFLQTIALKDKVGENDLDGIMTDAIMEAENVIMINLLRWNNAVNALTAVNPLPRYQYAADPDNIGFSNLIIDRDGRIRRQMLLLSDVEDNIYAHIGLRIIAKYLNSSIDKRGNHLWVGDFAIPVTHDNEMLINFAGPTGTFPIVSFYKAWQSAHRGDTGYFKKNFHDKIVLIGPGNIYSQDFKPTPYYRSRYYTGTRQTSGVEIMANVINTILERRFITSLQLWQAIFIVLFLGVLTSFASFKLSPGFGGISSFAIAAGYVYLCVVLFCRYNLLLDLICSVMVVPLTYTTVFSYRYTIEDKEKRRIKRIFKRYVSEEVVEELLQYPSEIPLGGNRVQATVLFSDIRGFTTLSENNDPQYIVSLLNAYFSMMVDIILKNKGTLDKYIGDGILAFYGAPIPREEHADLAVNSAIEMVSNLAMLSKNLALDTPLSIGIGIHSGEAVVGNIGSKRKMEYTIIGDTVNVASRIESLTKEFKANILITEMTFSRLKSRYHIIPEKEIVLRGKTKPVMLYRVEI